jgi:hypothetical protein
MARDPSFSRTFPKVARCARTVKFGGCNPCSLRGKMDKHGLAVKI